MPESAEGSAEAHDAAIDTGTVVFAEDPLPHARATVEAAKAKVERQRQHLAGAEQSLEAAEAALAELEGA